MHPYEYSLIQMAQAAIKGDLKAIELLMGLFRQHGIIGSEEIGVEWPSILRIPVDYDRDEWNRNLELFGPPPWPLEHDGLPHIQELRDAVRR